MRTNGTMRGNVGNDRQTLRRDLCNSRISGPDNREFTKLKRASEHCLVKKKDAGLSQPIWLGRSAPDFKSR